MQSYARCPHALMGQAAGLQHRSRWQILCCAHALPRHNLICPPPSQCFSNKQAVGSCCSSPPRCPCPLPQVTARCRAGVRQSSPLNCLPGRIALITFALPRHLLQSWSCIFVRGKTIVTHIGRPGGHMPRPLCRERSRLGGNLCRSHGLPVAPALARRQRAHAAETHGVTKAPRT